MNDQIIDLYCPYTAAVDCADAQSMTYSNSIGSQIASTQLIAWSASQGIEMITLGLQAARLLQADAQLFFSPAHLVVSITVLQTSNFLPSADTENSDESTLRFRTTSKSNRNKDEELCGEFMRVDFVEVAAPLDTPSSSPLCVDYLSGSALSHVSTREIRKAFSSHSSVIGSKGSRGMKAASIHDRWNKSALTYYLQDSIGQVSCTYIGGGNTLD